MKTKERIPLHDHVDNNSGGPLDRSTIVAAVGGSSSLGGGSGGSTTTIIESSTIYRNVMDYGAVGDGTTDDTVALQAAIDACTAFETLFFPTGVYKITATLTIPVGLRLLGAGADNINYDSATTIHMTTANTTAISATVFEADITIENITILGAGGASSGRGLYSSSNTRLRSVRIADFYDAVYIDDSLGVPPSSAFYNHIERSWFVRNTHAGLVLHTKTNNTSISESYFAAQAYGVLADGGAFGLRIVNSSFEIHTSVAISIDGTGASQSTKGVYIAGCYFEQITGTPTADVLIGPTTRVYGVLIEGCFFIESAVTTLRHIDVNFATGVTIIGNYIGNNAEAGAIRGDATNTLDMAVINNYVPGTVSTPATTRLVDSTDVTPASVGVANAVGSSKYLARADHVHDGSGSSGASALDDLTDVTLTTPTSGDRLRYSGSEWVNSALRWEPHVAYDGTVVLDGNGDPVMVEVS